MKILIYLCLLILPITSIQAQINTPVKPIKAPEESSVERVSNEELLRLKIIDKIPEPRKVNKTLSQKIPETWYFLIGIAIGMFFIIPEKISRENQLEEDNTLKPKLAISIGILCAVSFIWLTPLTVPYFGDISENKPIFYSLMGILLFVIGWTIEEDLRAKTIPTTAVALVILLIVNFQFILDKNQAIYNLVNTTIEFTLFCIIIKLCHFIFKKKTNQTTYTKDGIIETLQLRKNKKGKVTMKIGEDPSVILKEIIYKGEKAIAKSKKEKREITITQKYAKLVENGKVIEIIKYKDVKKNECIIQNGIELLTIPRSLMGIGDYYLIVLASIILGLAGGMATLFIASTASIAINIIIRIKKRRRNEKISDEFAFGPYLLGAMLLLMTILRPTLVELQTQLRELPFIY